MVAYSIVILILALVVVFSVQNAAPVVVSFLLWRFESSLAIVIVLSVLTGMLIGGIITSIGSIRRSLKKNKTEGEKTA